MSTAEGPDNGWSFAAHSDGGYRCGYAPLLTDGRLVRSRDPAWQMAEKTRDPGCLTEMVRVRAVKGYTLGFFHSHRSQREYPGYPDFHIWADRAAILREAKRMGESPRPEQAATLTRMRQAGLNVGVWWPCCWYAGWIDAELGQLAQAKTLIGGHWAPGLPAQPGQPGYVPWTPEAAPPAPASASGPSTRSSHARRARAEQLAPASPPTPRPPAELPGADLPPGFGQRGPAYVIPMPATARASDAGVHLDKWLRAHGFPTTAVPYPVRIIDDAAGVAVQCRAGGPGSPRTWRWAPNLSTLPSALIAALDAETLYGPAVAELLGETDPAEGRPAA